MERQKQRPKKEQSGLDDRNINNVILLAGTLRNAARLPCKMLTICITPLAQETFRERMSHFHMLPPAQEAFRECVLPRRHPVDNENIWVHVHAYQHVCVHATMCVCLYVCMLVYVSTYANELRCLCVRVYVCMCQRMYDVCTHVCVFAHEGFYVNLMLCNMMPRAVLHCNAR